MSESTPHTPLDNDFIAPEQEKAHITDAKCLEAMRAGDFEKVRAWYAEQEASNDLQFDHRARLEFQIRYAKLQLDSGLIDPDTGESFAFPTLESLLEAYPAQDDETAHRVRSIIDQMREK